MAKLNLIETIETKLPTLTKTDGQLIIIRDNASLYVDLDGARIYISDWIDVSTDEERLAMLSPLSNKYYYVVETNKIWRYISGSWVLVTSKNYEDLNDKPQIEGVELVGNKTLADFGGKKQIRISWEDYQALSTEEQNDESIVYYIYDYPNNVVNASDISYDNVTSLLSSTNVQDVIDELNNKLTTTEYYSIENVRYAKAVSVIKCGNICMIRINGTQEELTVDADCDICTLPENLKPTFNILKNLPLAIGDNTAYGYFYIMGNGTIRIKPKATISANSSLYINETYIIGGTLP